jgi:hypothetical protein
MGKNTQITLDTNGDDMRGGVKAVALLLRPEITDPDLLLDQYVTTDPFASDHGDYWA